MQVIFKRKILLISVLLAGGMCCSSAGTAENVDQAAPPAAAKDEAKTPPVGKLEYQLDNRPDPFHPFLSKDSGQKKPGEELVDTEGEVLEGMRRFEPGQLRLVAVMSTSRGRIAMAEDVAGVGYLLNEGMLIGKNGQITRIEDGQVMILETSKTTSGRIIRTDIVMRLKKEGEK